MSKPVKIVLIVLIVALLIFGVIFAVYSEFKTEPMDANSQQENILDDANEGLNNLINDIFDENQENEEVQNNEDNTDVTNTENSNNNKEEEPEKETNSSLEGQTTPGEKKAVDLVKDEWKKEWGSLDGVSFNNVSIQSDGKYLVAVNDSKTTRLIHSYIVDISTGVVEEKE